LHDLVSSFGDICDPEETGEDTIFLAGAFSGQARSPPSDVSYAVLLAGDDVLGTILKKGLICDPVVFKRMIRPVIPAKRDLPSVKYGSSDMAIALVPQPHLNSETFGQFFYLVLQNCCAWLKFVA
jgi:hypothetical protein